MPEPYGMGGEKLEQEASERQPHPCKPRKDAVGQRKSGAPWNRLECEQRRLAMAHRFTVIFEKEAEGGYHVFCPTLPGCHTQSETVEEGDENNRDAIELYIKSLVKAGRAIVGSFSQ